MERKTEDTDGKRSTAAETKNTTSSCNTSMQCFGNRFELTGKLLDLLINSKLQ